MTTQTHMDLDAKVLFLHVFKTHSLCNYFFLTHFCLQEIPLSRQTSVRLKTIFKRRGETKIFTIKLENNAANQDGWASKN